MHFLPFTSNFEVKTLVPPLIPKFLIPTPFNPKSPKKSSSAESREYMLTYFWGMGSYFYWGIEAYSYWGDGSKSLGGG